MDKNYIKPESDSLISIAVGYYGSFDDHWVAKGKSYFYYGRVMKELNRPEDAMRYYLKAKSLFEGSKEYKMLGLISDEMGTLNWSQDMAEEVLSNYMDALKYYSLAKDTLCMSYALRSLGRYYLSVHADFDSAYAYYQKALSVAHEHNCNSELTILQELGLFYRIRKDYKKAEYYLLKALNLDEDVAVFSEIYLSLGFTYLLMGNQNEAEIYLKKATEVANSYTQIGAYNLLFELEKQRKEPWKAIDYKEKSDSLNKINQNAEIKQAVVDLQKKYRNEKLQKENLQLKIKNQSILLLCFLLFSLVFVSVFYFYYKHRHNKKRMREIEQQIIMNREEITLYQEELAKYQQLQSESEDYRSKIGELNGKVLLLQSQNKTLDERLSALGGDVNNSCSPVDAKYISIFRMLLSIKSGFFKGELSRTDWGHLFDLFNYLYADIIVRLQKEYPQLTKHDLEICCLLKFGFTNDALKRVFFTTSDSITKAKGRLKKRLNVSPQEDLDSFIRNY
ncbi:tetratricopeptide repeat protein [Bacteroides sp.]